MFKTIIGYLFRQSHPEGSVSIKVTTNAGARVEVTGLVPQELVLRDEADLIGDAKFRLSLGEPLLRTFAANNGATYHGPEQLGTRTVFRLSFPLRDAVSEEGP
jgi:hypothetical protein